MLCCCFSYQNKCYFEFQLKSTQFLIARRSPLDDWDYLIRLFLGMKVLHLRFDRIEGDEINNFCSLSLSVVFLQVMKNNHFESLFKLFSWNIINVVGVVDDDLSDWNFVFVFANQVLLFLFLNERSNSKIVFLLFNVFLLPVEKNTFLALLSSRPYLLLFDNWILSF